MQVVIVNHSTVVTDRELAPVVAAMNVQCVRDLAPVWAAKATVFNGTGLRLPRKAWQIDILDDSDQAGALGYHSVSMGIPNGRVFAKTCLDDGVSWTVCLSHEILETVVDPTCRRAVSLGGGRLVATEVGDPVEADEVGYLIDGVLVSDFVTPNWFHGNLSGPYDFGRHLTRPLTLLEGGYALVKQGGRWQQITAHERSLKATLSARSWYRAVAEEELDWIKNEEGYRFIEDEDDA